MNYELIGTVASMIVLASFMQTGERKIRLLNLFGAVLFVIYGLAIDAFSVWFLNGALTIVHLKRLISPLPSVGRFAKRVKKRVR